MQNNKNGGLCHLQDTKDQEEPECYSLTFSHSTNQRKNQAIKLFKRSSSVSMWPSRERFKKVQPFFFFLTTWSVSTPFPFKTHPSQLAALSIIYFGCLLENKWSCSCRWVCQTCVYFPVSGPFIVLVETWPFEMDTRAPENKF